MFFRCSGLIPLSFTWGGCTLLAPCWLLPSSGQALCILASSHTPIPLYPGGRVTMKPSLSGFLQGQGQSLHKAGPVLYRQPCAGPDFVMQDMMQGHDVPVPSSGFHKTVPVSGPLPPFSVSGSLTRCTRISVNEVMHESYQPRWGMWFGKWHCQHVLLGAALGGSGPRGTVVWSGVLFFS